MCFTTCGILQCFNTPTNTQPALEDFYMEGDVLKYGYSGIKLVSSWWQIKPQLANTIFSAATTLSRFSFR